MNTITRRCPAEGHRGKKRPLALARASESARVRFPAAQGKEADTGQCSNPGHNDGHNLLFRACFGTPAQILSRDETGKRDLTTQFMFFALLRKGINDEFSGWTCPGRDVLIASTDRDYYQLLCDGGPDHGAVRVLNTAMRPGRRLIGPAEVTGRYGITPAQYPDFRALSGDTSDNIPGVRGVGAKTAAALLAGGLRLEDLPASGRLSGGKGTAITAAWPQVLTWRSMIQMRPGLPLPAGPTGAATTPLPIPGDVIAQLGLGRCTTTPAAPAMATTAT